MSAERCVLGRRSSLEPSDGRALAQEGVRVVIGLGAMYIGKRHWLWPPGVWACGDERREMKGGEKTASKLRAVNKIGRAPLAAVRTDARAQDCVFMEEATIRGAENVQYHGRSANALKTVGLGRRTKMKVLQRGV